MSTNNTPVNTADPTTQTSEEESSTPQTGQTPAPQGQTPQGNGKTPLESLPPDIQQMIHGLREEAKKYREEKQAEARGKKELEQQRLADMATQGQYKELSETQAKRLAELEPIAERYNTLANQRRAAIQAETRTWGPEVKAFYPGDDAPIEQLEEWLARSKPIVEKFQQQARGTQPGNSPNPKPVGEMTPEQQQQATEQRLRRTGLYGSR